jgi:hypothetical protein
VETALPIGRGALRSRQGDIAESLIDEWDQCFNVSAVARRMAESVRDRGGPPRGPDPDKGWAPVFPHRGPWLNTRAGRLPPPSLSDSADVRSAALDPAAGSRLRRLPGARLKSYHAVGVVFERDDVSVQITFRGPFWGPRFSIAPVTGASVADPSRPMTGFRCRVIYQATCQVTAAG